MKSAGDYIDDATRALMDASLCIDVLQERIEELEKELIAKEDELAVALDELADLTGKGR